MRLILATNHKGLDSYLKERAEDLGITIVKEVYFREALTSVVRQYPADALLLASNLPGSDRTSILDYVYQARMANMRVIVLTGEKDPKDEVAPALVALGVYDILFGEIQAADIERVLKKPMTMPEIVRAWGIPGKPKPPSGFLNRLRSAIPKAETQLGTSPESPAEESASSAEEPIKSAIREQPKERKPKKSKGQSRTQKTNLPLLAEPLDEASAMTRPGRPLVAVWSPCSSGKTFVSLYLAKALAQKGLKVGLVDLNLERQDLCQWLLLPEGEDALTKALSLDVLFSQEPVTGEWRHGLMVFSDDLGTRDQAQAGAMVEDGNLMRFFNSPKVPADVLVCDLPSRLEPYVRKILEHAWAGVLVGDQDYAHSALFKDCLKQIAWEPFVVVNKYAEFEGWDPKEALGKESACNIPVLAPALYVAIAEGGLAKEGVDAVDSLAAKITEHLGRDAIDRP